MSLALMLFSVIHSLTLEPPMAHVHISDLSPALTEQLRLQVNRASLIPLHHYAVYLSITHSIARQ